MRINTVPMISVENNFEDGTDLVLVGPHGSLETILMMSDKVCKDKVDLHTVFLPL